MTNKQPLQSYNVEITFNYLCVHRSINIIVINHVVESLINCLLPEHTTF